MPDMYIAFSFKIKDSLGDTSSTDDLVLEAPDGLTLLQLQTHLNTWSAALDAVTDGQIIQITAKIDMALTALKGAPVEGSEVQRNMRISWTQAVIPAKFGVDVPAVKDELIVGGKINTADALIVAFNNALLSVALADGAQLVSKQRNLLISPVSALLSFRGDRGPEDRSFF
jgi:hypothetical protein